jgi:ferritin-like metal-binding protein YciE
MHSLNELYVHLLRDVLYAERTLLKALPRMARHASTDGLRQAFAAHRDETEEQVRRLEEVFDLAGQRPRAMTCEAIKGLVEEAEEVVEEIDAGPVRDAGLLACAQAVEHYEIARYGALAAWAEALGQDEAAKLLRRTLEEEKKTDGLLNRLAESGINRMAAEPRDDGGEVDEGGEERGAPASAQPSGSRGRMPPRAGTRRRRAA